MNWKEVLHPTLEKLAFPLLVWSFKSEMVFSTLFKCGPCFENTLLGKFYEILLFAPIAVLAYLFSCLVVFFVLNYMWRIKPVQETNKYVASGVLSVIAFAFSIFFEYSIDKWFFNNLRLLLFREVFSFLSIFLVCLIFYSMLEQLLYRFLSRIMQRTIVVSLIIFIVFTTIFYFWHTQYLKTNLEEGVVLQDIGVCQNIAKEKAPLSFQRAEICRNSIAISAQNKKYCDSLDQLQGPYYNTRDRCVNLVTRYSDQPEKCDPDDRNKPSICTTDERMFIAVRFNNEKLCPSDLCRAVISGKEGVCDGVDDKNSCLHFLAINQKNARFCDDISRDSAITDDCFFDLAILTRNSTLCKNYRDLMPCSEIVKSMEGRA